MQCDRGGPLRVLLNGWPCVVCRRWVFGYCLTTTILAFADLSAQHTGVIYGLTSACAAVVGSAGTFLTGVVLDTTDSWVLVFQVRLLIVLYYVLCLN